MGNKTLPQELRKFFQKTLRKPLDKYRKMWYNNSVKRREKLKVGATVLSTKPQATNRKPPRKNF